MDADSPKRRALSRVISPRELRLLFWLIVIVLVGVIGVLGSGIADTLSGPAVILFVAWLMAYVLEPAVTWLTRHLPFHSRGLSVAVTYLATVVVTFAVLLGAGAALLNAAMTFVERLPEIAARVRELVEPLATSLGLSPPAPIDLADAIAEPGDGKRRGHRRRRRSGRAERVRGRCRALHGRGDLGGDGRRRGDPARLAPAIPARAILRGHRRPRASHRPFVWWVHPRPRPDRADLRRPHLDRGLPPGYPLRAAHRGHRGSASSSSRSSGRCSDGSVLPGFALVLAPEVAAPALVISLLIAALMQLIVTRMVMGRAVKISAAAVLAVVMLGAAIAGVLGAIFAIPTAGAILAITDYLRKRDVLLRARDRRTPSTTPRSPIQHRSTE